MIERQNDLHADCSQCFGLCCVALPFAKSADFAMDKDGGTPCVNLREDYLCGIHSQLRDKGFKGCTVYECFGAGQKVSQITYAGTSWRGDSEVTEQMFKVFPIMQQLHEMLSYLDEALRREETKAIHAQLKEAYQETKVYTLLSPEAVLKLDIPTLRAGISKWLSMAGELVGNTRANKQRTKYKTIDFIGAKLKNKNFQGANLRGILFLAADLRGADMRAAELLGADLRDADLSGADLTEAIFLTQAQVNAAKGDQETKLPTGLNKPGHWV
ncbi:pentapeptide repeat-containing protein [Alkalicoccobacillus murimartini]|nr:pentapeptide repeat-containing protein [Alkalicoccobacillus murimartini]